ncbi:MAG: hypothetical protein JO366_12180 [Methylobacteriaceae bacterium]|nr:hypothetical protein [Methylobacteriaceae bacterium]MBV9702727.1 hypothetical protein [Methylobacteriaceae bacterium]
MSSGFVKSNGSSGDLSTNPDFRAGAKAPRHGGIADGPYRFSFVVTLIVAIALISAGVALITLASKGDMEIAVGGTILKTETVGIAVIVLGAFLVISSVGRNLSSIKRLRELIN